MNLKVLYKLIKRKYRLIPSFCKVCGRDVHDFYVDDKIWNKVSKHIKYGNINDEVLCYDCFCELGKKENIFPEWKLVELD